MEEKKKKEAFLYLLYMPALTCGIWKLNGPMFTRPVHHPLPCHARRDHDGFYVLSFRYRNVPEWKNWRAFTRRTLRHGVGAQPQPTPRPQHRRAAASSSTPRETKFRERCRLREAHG